MSIHHTEGAGRPNPFAERRVPPITTTLRGIAARCAVAVPTATGCGVSLLTTDARRITSVATDLLGERVLELHDRCRDDPGTSAWLHGNVIRVAVGSPRGHGSWSTSAGRLGVRRRRLGSTRNRLVARRHGRCYRPRLRPNDVVPLRRTIATVVAMRPRPRSGSRPLPTR